MADHVAAIVDKVLERIADRGHLFTCRVTVEHRAARIRKDLI